MDRKSIIAVVPRNQSAIYFELVVNFSLQHTHRHDLHVVPDVPVVLHDVLLEATLIVEHDALAVPVELHQKQKS